MWNKRASTFDRIRKFLLNIELEIAENQAELEKQKARVEKYTNGNSKRAIDGFAKAFIEVKNIEIYIDALTKLKDEFMNRVNDILIKYQPKQTQIILSYVLNKTPKEQIASSMGISLEEINSCLKSFSKDMYYNKVFDFD